MATNTIHTSSVEGEEVEDTVRKHLAAFARGDFDAWGAQFAPNVFFTAADPEEVFSEREAAVAEMHKDFDPAFQEGLQLDIEPESFRIGLSSDHNTAWSAVPLRYTVSFQGETTSFLIRHTALLSKSDNQWSILVTQYSLALPESKVLQALTTERLPAPRNAGDSIGPGAEVIVEEFTQQLADLSTAVISRDAYVFSLLPGEHSEGETAIRALFAKWTSLWGALRLRPDGVRSELLSDGEMGWVGANVDVTMSYIDQPIILPLRALAVYRKEQGIWAIVHAHFSVGVPDDIAE